MRIEHIGDATRTTSIYALCEFPSWEVRYIGKTDQYIHDRHKAHIRAAKRGGKLPVHYWIRKQIALGNRLAIKHIEFVGSASDWSERERYWIQFYRASGARLLNLTDGGEGLSGHALTQSHKDRIAASLKTGSWFNCTLCGERFWRKPYDIKQGHNKFCSRACSNIYNKGGTYVS